jgi:hypothetical protein
MSIGRVERFQSFLFNPASCAKTPLGKVGMVALDFFLGVSTLGLVHLGFGAKILIQRRFSPLESGSRPWNTSAFAQQIIDAQTKVAGATHHTQAQFMPEDEQALISTITEKHVQISNIMIQLEEKEPIASQKERLTFLFHQLEDAWENAPKEISSSVAEARLTELRKSEERLQKFRQRWFQGT